MSTNQSNNKFFLPHSGDDDDDDDNADTPRNVANMSDIIRDVKSEVLQKDKKNNDNLAGIGPEPVFDSSSDQRHDKDATTEDNDDGIVNLVRPDETEPNVNISECNRDENKSTALELIKGGTVPTSTEVTPDSTDTATYAEAIMGVENNPDTSSNKQAFISVVDNHNTNREAMKSVVDDPNTTSNIEENAREDNNPNTSSKTEASICDTEHNINESATQPKNSRLSECEYEADSRANAEDTTTIKLNTSSVIDCDIGASKPIYTTMEVPAATYDIPKSFSFATASSETNSDGSNFPPFLKPRTSGSINSESNSESSFGGSFSGGQISKVSDSRGTSNSSGYGSPDSSLKASCDIIEKPNFGFDKPRSELLDKTARTSEPTDSLFGKPVQWNTGPVTPNNSDTSSINVSGSDKPDPTVSRSGESINDTTESTGAIPKIACSFEIPKSDTSKSTSVKSAPTYLSFAPSSVTSSAVGSNLTSTLTTVSSFGSCVTTATDDVPKTRFIKDSSASKTTGLISATTGTSGETPNAVSSKNTEQKSATSTTNSITPKQIDVTSSSDTTNLTDAKLNKTITFGTLSCQAAKPAESSINASTTGTPATTNLTSSKLLINFSFGIPNSGPLTSTSADSLTNKSSDVSALDATNSSATTTGTIQKPSFSFGIPNSSTSTSGTNSGATNSSETTTGTILKSGFSFGMPNTESSTSTSNKSSTSGTNSGAANSSETSIGAMPKSRFNFGIPNTESSTSTSNKSSTSGTNSGATNSSETTTGTILKSGFSFGMPNTESSTSTSNKSSTSGTNSGAANSSETSTGAMPKSRFNFRIPITESSTSSSNKFSTSGTNSSVANCSEITTGAIPKSRFNFGIPSTESSTSISNKSSTSGTNSDAANSSETITGAMPKSRFNFGIPNTESSTSSSNKFSTSGTNSGAANSSETTTGAMPKSRFNFGIPTTESSTSSSNKSSTSGTYYGAANSSETTTGAMPKSRFIFGIPSTESSTSLSNKSSTSETNSSAANSSEATSGAMPKSRFNFEIPNTESSTSTSNKSSTSGTNSGAANSSETTAGAMPKSRFNFGIPSTESSTLTSNKSSTSGTNSSAASSSETTAGAIPKSRFNIGIPNTNDKTSTSVTNSSAANSSETTTGAVPKSRFSFGIPKAGSSEPTSSNSTNKSSGATNSSATTTGTTLKPSFVISETKSGFSFGISNTASSSTVTNSGGASSGTLPKTSLSSNMQSKPSFSFGLPNKSPNTTKSNSKPIFGAPSASTTPIFDFASSSKNMVQSFKKVLAKNSSQNSNSGFVFGNSQGGFANGTGFCTNRTANVSDCSGTGVVRYKPVKDVDIVIRLGESKTVDVNICVISCMREYETKSIEELRHEDYLAGRKGRTHHKCAFCTPGAICVYDKNFAPYAWTYTDIFNKSMQGNVIGRPTSKIVTTDGRGTGVIRYKPTVDEENCNLCVISVMKEYETKSLDELRHEDYMAKRQGQTTHKCSFCPSDYYCSFDKKYNSKPQDNSSPNTSAFGTSGSAKSVFPNMFGANSMWSAFDTFPSSVPFGTPPSNIQFGTTASSNIFGASASNIAFSTSASNSTFGASASNIAFGTPASISTFGASASSGSPFGTPNNGPFGGASSNATPINKSLFGTTTFPNSSGFGSPNTAFNTPSTSKCIFGITSTAQSNAPSTNSAIFGSSSTAFNAPSTARGIFDPTNTISTASSTDTTKFGSTTAAFNAPSTSKGIFGQASTAQSKFAMFGATSTAVNAPSTTRGIFDPTNTISTASSTDTTTFGQSSTNQSNSVFGSTSTAVNAPSTNRGIFDRTKALSTASCTDTTKFGSTTAAFNAPSTSKVIFGPPRTTQLNLATTNTVTFGSPSTTLNMPSIPRGIFGASAARNPSNTNINSGISTATTASNSGSVFFGLTNNSIQVANTNASLFGPGSTGAIFKPDNNFVTSPRTVSSIFNDARSSLGSNMFSGNINVPVTQSATSNLIAGNQATTDGIDGISSSCPNPYIPNNGNRQTNSSRFGTGSSGGTRAVTTGTSNRVPNSNSMTTTGINNTNTSSNAAATTSGNRVAAAIGNSIANSNIQGSTTNTGNTLNNTTTAGNSNATSSNIPGVASTVSNSNAISSNILSAASTVGNSNAISSNILSAASTVGNSNAISSNISGVTAIGVANTSDNGVASITNYRSIYSTASTSQASFHDTNVAGPSTSQTEDYIDMSLNMEERWSNVLKKQLPEVNKFALKAKYSIPINTNVAGSSISQMENTYQNIPPNAIAIWNDILKKGLSDSSKTALQQHYSIPENMGLLKAPTMNPEIANNDQMTEELKSTDKKIQNQQDLLGNGIVAIIKAMDLLLSKESAPYVFRALINSVRLLTDLHFNMTKERGDHILPLLEDNVRDILMERERDATIFGSDMSEMDVGNMFKRTPTNHGMREANSGSDVNQSEAAQTFQLLESISDFKVTILTKIDQLIEKVDSINDERDGESISTPSADNVDSSNSESISLEDPMNDEDKLPLDDKFQPGNYVVLKSNIQWSGNTMINNLRELTIYFVVSGMLLNKYTSLHDYEEDTLQSVIYNQSKQYTGWSKKKSEDFYSITSAVVENVPKLIDSKRITVRFDDLTRVLEGERTILNEV